MYKVPAHPSVDWCTTKVRLETQFSSTLAVDALASAYVRHHERPNEWRLRWLAMDDMISVEWWWFRVEHVNKNRNRVLQQHHYLFTTIVILSAVEICILALLYVLRYNLQCLTASLALRHIRVLLLASTTRRAHCQHLAYAWKPFWALCGVELAPVRLSDLVSEGGDDQRSIGMPSLNESHVNVRRRVAQRLLFIVYDV